MKCKNLPTAISLLDYYIVKLLIQNFILYIAITSIFSEFVGISFEQISFLVEQQLSFKTLLLIHWLKFPYFVYFSVPFALLITNLNLYTTLSKKHEIIAMYSFGISVHRIIVPTIVVASIFTITTFIFHELIVPNANYQAAINLENQWNIDRRELSKYNKKNIIYQEFEVNQNNKNIKLLFYAVSFDGQSMKDVTVINYKDKKINEIIIAKFAKWIEKQETWKFYKGSFYTINKLGNYNDSSNFQQLSVKLTKNIYDYVNHYRDPREMNIIDLYRRYKIVKLTNNIKQIRSLKTNIYQRYSESLSCFTFSLLGSALGISSKNRVFNNSFGIAILLVIVIFMFKILSIYLSTSGTIPISLGVLLPNILCLVIGLYLLTKKQYV